MASIRFTGLFSILLFLFLCKFEPAIAPAGDYNRFKAFLLRDFGVIPQEVARHLAASPTDRDGIFHWKHINKLHRYVDLLVRKGQYRHEQALNFVVANLLTKKDLDTRRRRLQTELLRGQVDGGHTREYILEHIRQIDQDEARFYQSTGFAQEQNEQAGEINGRLPAPRRNSVRR